MRDKAVLALGLLACALTLPWWPGGVLTGVVALAVLLGPAAVGPRVLVRSLTAPLLFIAVGAASLLVTISWAGGPVVGLSSSFAPAVTVVVRGTAMVALVASLRRGRVPQACIDVVAVAYRMVFVLLDSARAVREAQAARLGYDGRRAALRSVAVLIGAVLVLAWDRAERLEAGLAGRGGGEALRTLDPPRKASTGFLLISLVCLAGVAVTGVLG